MTTTITAINQHKIHKNLATILSLINAEHSNATTPAKSEWSKKHLKELQEKLKNFGRCFGHSVIHGAMDYVGKLEWWEAALKKIENWKETDSLNELVELPDAELNEDGTKGVPFYTVCFRVLDYLMFNQAANFMTDFVPNDFNQVNFLKPDLKFFELLTPDGTVKTVQDLKTIACKFTLEDLQAVLEEKNFTDTIAVLGGTGHAIRIGYKNGSWLLHDPDNGTLTFNTKKELAKKIFETIGNTFAIQIASLDQEKQISLIPFAKVINNIENLQGLSFFLIAQYAPNDLPIALDFLARQTEPNGDDVKVSLLISSALNLALQGKQRGFNTLQIIAYSTPTLLPRIFELAGKFRDKSFNAGSIARALRYKCPRTGITGFNTLASVAPEVLQIALEHASCDEQSSSELIAEALAEIDKNKNTGLYLLARLARSSPQAIKLALTIALKSNKGQRLIKQAFDAQVNPDDKFFLLATLVEVAPDTLFIFKPCILNIYESVKNNLFEAIKTSSHTTVVQLLLENIITEIEKLQNADGTTAADLLVFIKILSSELDIINQPSKEVTKSCNDILSIQEIIPATDKKYMGLFSNNQNKLAPVQDIVGKIKEELGFKRSLI